MKKVFIIIFLLLLLFSMGQSQIELKPIDKKMWILSDTKEVVTLIDKNISKVSTKNMSIKTINSSLEIISNVDRYEIGDFDITREWGYKNKGSEYVRSKKAIIQKGNKLCIKEDKTISADGLLQQTHYFNCIEYPPQYVNVTELIINKTYSKGLNHTYQINARNITKINDYNYKIDFLKDYDPISTGLTTGLVFCHNYDDANISGSTVYDVHNYKHNGTIISGTTGNIGILEESIYFDGDDDYINVSHSDDFNIDTGAFTISFWLNTSDDPATRPVFFYKGDENDPRLYIIGLPDQNPEGISFQTRGTTDCLYSPEFDYNDGQWHHIVYMRKGGDCSSDYKIYIDGNSVESGNLDVDGDDSDPDNNKPIHIGNDYALTKDFNGQIDELCFWTRDLNTTEISDLYNSGAGWAYPFTPNGSGTTQTPTPTADLLNISQNNESVYLNASSSCQEKCLLYQDGVNLVNFSSFPYNRTGLSNATSYSFNFTIYNSTYDIPESNFSNTITTTTLQNTPIIVLPSIFDEKWNETSVIQDTHITVNANVTHPINPIDTVIFEIQFPNGTKVNYTGSGGSGSTSWTFSETPDATYWEGDWDDTNDATKVYDGNYNTYGVAELGNGTANANVYFNYTKIANALNTSKIQIKNALGTYNFTINQSCFNQDPIQFKLNSIQIANPYAMYYCWNSTDWMVFVDYSNPPSGGGQIYEEAMWWNINGTDKYTYELTTTNQIGTYNLTTVWANDTSNNINVTHPYKQVNVTAPADTCTPPDSGNYAVSCSDNCVWSTPDTIPGNITMTGSGTVTLSTEWTFTGSNQFIYINSGCTFKIESGGVIQ